MALKLLLIVPFCCALLAYVLPPVLVWRWWRPWLIPVSATIQLLLSVYCGSYAAGQGLFSDWLVLDPLATLFLLGTNTLCCACGFYAPAYLHWRGDHPNRIFCTSFLLLMGIMQLVFVSQHLGLTWVAIEATSLVSAPLIYFRRNALALEAVWKYLLICSVGIALALLGSFFLAYAALSPNGELHSTLLFPDLISHAAGFSRPWLQAAFVTLLLGYGTKMGIAPLHTWKPDAYGESPGLTGAMLAGGVTSCAFLVLVRICMVMRAAGEFSVAAPYLKAFGLFSILVAALFLVGQRDFKRMLAYSSVEHMGILLLGMGVGGLGTFAALFHLLNNSFTKGILFLSAGNIHRTFGSKSTEQVRGAMKVLPWSSGLLLLGLFAATSSPPFSPFFSVYALLQALFTAGEVWTGVAFLLLLFVAFFGMGATVMAVTQGEPEVLTGDTRRPPETFGLIAPLIALALVVVLLGVFHPSSVMGVIQRAADFAEMKR